MKSYLWTMAVLWAIAFIAGLRTKPGEVDKPATHGSLVFSALPRAALLAWTLFLLTACGGGGDPATDEPNVPTPTVVCPSADPTRCL